jgi:hypothetical protein
VERLRNRGLPVRHWFIAKMNAPRDCAQPALRLVGDLTVPMDVARVLEGCQRIYFGMSVSPPYLEATVIAATVAREGGDIEAFVNISQNDRLANEPDK